MTKLQVTPSSSWRAIDGTLHDSQLAAQDHSLAFAASKLFNYMKEIAGFQPMEAVQAIIGDFAQDANPHAVRGWVEFLLANSPITEPAASPNQET